jgi:Tol biopolymer transport system component
MIAIAVSENNGFASTSKLLVLTSDGKLVRSIMLPFVPAYGNSIVWLSDTSGLLIVNSNQAASPGGQIWFQPYPSGAPLKITNDLNGYASLSMTGDGKSFVATQQRPELSMYTGVWPPVSNHHIDAQLAILSAEQTEGFRLGWTGSQKLVEQSLSGELFMLAADGKSRTPLLPSTEQVGSWTTCGPGDSIVFTRPASDGREAHLWRLDSNTGNVTQITMEPGLQYGPSCTADGQTLVYSSEDRSDAGTQTVMKRAVNGGNPSVLIAITTVTGIGGTVSPDGRYLIYEDFSVIRPPVNAATPDLVVRSMTDGSLVKRLSLTFVINPISLQWAPDSAAVLFTDAVKAQLYMQPLLGGHPVQLTDFSVEPMQVAAFAFSRDGKKIAVTRQRARDTDVVLFSNFH